MFIDLKREYSLDLMGFLSGEVRTSPRFILAMIKHLPEGTNYVAARAAELAELRELGTQTPTDEPAEADPIEELKQWTEDRRLMAQLINSVNMLVKYSVQWQKTPDIPLVGPSSWRGEGARNPSKAMTVMDVINRVTGTNG